MSNQTMTAKEAMKWSRVWATEFGDANADLLTCFPSERVAAVLLAQAATEKRRNEVCELSDIARWFLSAYDRKLFVPDFPLTALAQEQLDELRTKFGPKAPVPGAKAEAVKSLGVRINANTWIVKVDASRFVASIQGSQIGCTNGEDQALAMSAADAQTLVSRLRRGHFPQAESVNVFRDREIQLPLPTASDVAGEYDYSQMTRAQFDALSSRDSKRLYASSASFRKRADQFWAGAA